MSASLPAPTRKGLRFRYCEFVGTRHCAKCRRKVELWTSSVNRSFYVDVLPAGDTATVTMHRETCPAQQRQETR